MLIITESIGRIILIHNHYPSNGNHNGSNNGHDGANLMCIQCVCYMFAHVSAYYYTLILIARRNFNYQDRGVAEAQGR